MEEGSDCALTHPVLSVAPFGLVVSQLSSFPAERVGCSCTAKEDSAHAFSSVVQLTHSGA